MMGYWVDRQQAFRDSELVAVVAIRQRKVRSRVLLRDGSAYQTLTRPRTLRRQLEGSYGHIIRKTR